MSINADPVQEQQNEEPQQQNAPISQEPAQPVASQPPIDYRSLYLDIAREHRTLQAQLEARAQTPAPTQQQSIDYNEMLRGERPADAIQALVQRELAASLGDVRELGQSYKMERAIGTAENTVFAQMADLVPYRDQIAPIVRQRMAAAGQQSPNDYYNHAMAVVGEFAMRAANAPRPNTPNPAPVPNDPPPSAPRTPGRAPTSNANAPRLSEAEKAGMRKIKLDPNKAEDVATWNELISDEPYVIRN